MQTEQTEKVYDAWGDEIIEEPGDRLRIVQEVRSKPIAWWKAVLLILMILVIAMALVLLAGVVRLWLNLPMTDLVIYAAAIVLGVWLTNRRIGMYSYELTGRGVVFARHMSRLDGKMLLVTPERMRGLMPYKPDQGPRVRRDQFRLLPKERCWMLLYQTEQGRDAAVIFQPNDEILEALKSMLGEAVH